jgi:hypothetical protein
MDARARLSRPGPINLDTLRGLSSKRPPTLSPSSPYAFSAQSSLHAIREVEPQQETRRHRSNADPSTEDTFRTRKRHRRPEVQRSSSTPLILTITSPPYHTHPPTPYASHLLSSFNRADLLITRHPTAPPLHPPSCLSSLRPRPASAASLTLTSRPRRPVSPPSRCATRSQSSLRRCKTPTRRRRAPLWRHRADQR